MLVVVGLRLWWGYSVDRRVDEMIAKYHAAGEPILPEDFASDPVPDEENAVWYYEQAAAAITHPTGVTITIDDISSNPELLRTHADEVATIMAANESFFEFAHQARSVEHTDWNFNLSGPLINTMLPSLKVYRAGAKLLTVAASKHALDGDPGLAVRKFEDALALANTVRESPTLISQLVAMAVDRLICSTLERASATIVNADSRDDVERLIRELLDPHAPNDGWSRAMFMERATYLDTVSRMANGTLTTSAMGGGSWPVTSRPADRALALIMGPAIKLSAIDIMAYADSAEQAGGQPTYPKAMQMYSDPSFPGIKGPSPSKRLGQLVQSILLPSFERALVIHFRVRAQRIMTATALAIHLYELDHGERPESLEELVPDYLPTAPLDPFHPDGKIIGYLPHADKPRLYSVGLDGVDDKGTYERKKRGAINLEVKDSPYFLNGPPPAIDESSTPLQPGHDGGDIENEQGNSKRNDKKNPKPKNGDENGQLRRSNGSPPE